jgi:hypothetical protein
MKKDTTKKFIYWGISAVSLVVVVIFSVFFFFSGEEEKIKQAIEKAKYCKQKEDCVKIPSQCPFGCWVVVNKNESERIQGMIDSYESECVYGCVELKGYDCIDNKCIASY